MARHFLPHLGDNGHDLLGAPGRVGSLEDFALLLAVEDIGGQGSLWTHSIHVTIILDFFPNIRFRLT